MRPRDFQPDELKGVRSVPVPGYPGVRADERGHLWTRNGRFTRAGRWERIGTGPKGRVTLRSEAGKRVGMFAYRAVCMAWHGPRPKNWCVRFLDGDARNLRPKNLEWAPTLTGRPRKLSRWQQLAALERAEAGEQLTDLAAELGVSVGTMTNLCKGYVRRGPSVAATGHHGTLCPADQRAEAVRQRLAGRKAAAVCLRFGLSPTHLATLVKRAKESTPCSPSA